MREPFIDKLPGLVSLLTYLADGGYEVDLLFCPTHMDYLPPMFLNEPIRFSPVLQGIHVGVPVPITLRLMIDVQCSCARSRPDLTTGAGQIRMTAGRGAIQPISKPPIRPSSDQWGSHTERNVSYETVSR